MNTISIRVKSPIDIRETRVTTKERGSWRWQDAFSISTYAPRQRRDGVWTWRSINRSGKFSEPQLRRAGIHAPHYSIRGQIAPVEQLRDEIYSRDN